MTLYSHMKNILKFRKTILLFIILLLQSLPVYSLEREDKEFKVFQFPSNMIPRIDGKTLDWNIVPENYAISLDELRDTVNNNPVDKHILEFHYL